MHLFKCTSEKCSIFHIREGFLLLKLYIYSIAKHALPNLKAKKICTKQNANYHILLPIFAHHQVIRLTFVSQWLGASKSYLKTKTVELLIRFYSNISKRHLGGLRALFISIWMCLRMMGLYNLSVSRQNEGFFARNLGVLNFETFPVCMSSLHVDGPLSTRPNTN